MKIPSINYLLQQTKTAVTRFPLSLLSALTGVVIAIYLTERGEELTDMLFHVNIMLTAALGLPLFFCLSMLAEKFRWTTTKRLVVEIAGVVFLLLVYFSFPGEESGGNISLPYVRYAIYNVTVHLF